jgi:hypothetical protein
LTPQGSHHLPLQKMGRYMYPRILRRLSLELEAN